MQRYSFIPALIGFMLLNHAAWSDEDSPRTNRVNKAVDEKANAPGLQTDPKNNAANDKPDVQSQSDELRGPDQQAIRETAKTYLDAFARGDAPAIAAHFTADAEYVDFGGTVTRGRDEIQKVYQTFFESHPSAKMQLKIESINFLSPTVALEDGMTVLLKADGHDAIHLPYTAVHLKEDGKWLVASVREHRHHAQREHRSQLHRLNWLVGDWIHEGAESIVHFECRPSIEGNYLIRNFSVQAAGKRQVTGIQMIGWDSQSQRLRAWIFDSDGGFAEGFWHQSQDEWFLELSGVTADGKSASSTSVYTPIDERTTQFRTINHQIGGLSLPDSDTATIVRRAARPGNVQNNAPESSATQSLRTAN